MVNIIVSNRKWNRKYADFIEAATQSKVYYIEERSQLTIDNLNNIKPDRIFFFHWSYIIPEEIYNSFECVIFHMTDLPFGRGGSPLQNLIVRGFSETKVSALKCIKEVDAGPIYLKKELSLWGSAEEIYIRAGQLCCDMAIEIINSDIKPQAQVGDVICFKRRSPKDSDISELTELSVIYDYIRMLDAEGYPKAFLNMGNIHFEFERASLNNGYIKADVKISVLGNNEEK